MWASVEGWSYYYSNDTMDWRQARAWCREHYTDMVAIQNQEEIEHLMNLLPLKRGYYWIGIRKINNVWTWVGTNKALTPEATNWAKGEPNNGKTGQILGHSEDCVEMYIKREEQPGKWNDERCGKKKTALCYTAACKSDSCLYGECVETINSHKCECFEGFYGERCEHAVKCNEDEVTVPYKGSVNCIHKYGNYSYDSVCHYSCEEGYQLSTPRPLRCNALKNWSESPPTCEVVQCPMLSHTSRGSMMCSDPLGSSSYQSTCVFTCDKGYELIGSSSNTLQCEASGIWNSSQPFCVAVQCPDLQEVENIMVNCGNDTEMRLSYGNTCSFSCAPGYKVVGPSEVTCTSEGVWSEKMPRCEVIGCPTPEVPAGGRISCTPSLSSPASTRTPYPRDAVCTFSCDEGYELQGALSSECAHTDQWTSPPPTCTAVRCPSLEAPENGRISCSNNEQVYNSQCSFTCNENHLLEGHELLTCGRHGNWTGEKPICQAPTPPTAVIASSLAIGGTVSLSSLTLAMWLMRRLRQKANKFELNSNSDIEAPPQMLQESAKVSLHLHHWVLIASLIVFVRDQSSGGGAHAWTYNYSISPNRRWPEARQWCQEHFTDIVAIQNQEETDFLNNFLPMNPKYYWIGIHKDAGMWIWVGTNKNVPDEAQNWAPEEPDSIEGQDCVEIYIKREKDTAKWNNEKCNRKKGAICYSVSCAQDSCSDHADCVETIGSYTCHCHPGFQGPRCEEAIPCEPLLDPKKGSHHCFDPYGSNRFNSYCRFNCELGFHLVGAAQLQCQSSGLWSHPVPLCQVEQCPPLSHINFTGGDLTCSHPIAPYSFNSTCEVRCHEGYEITGQDQIQCDPTGRWTASLPQCLVKKCFPIFFHDAGNMTCVDALESFSYGSECNFTCQEGFYLTGDNTLSCLASGQWNKPTPACTVVQCSSLNVTAHSSMQCRDPLSVHSYGSVCTIECEEGFDLIGSNMMKCSSQGNWSHPLPVCQAKQCHPINPPPHGSITCSDPNGSFSFGSACVSSCDKGFLLNGTAETECTSLGMWSTDVPSCFAMRCPPLNPPSHGSLVCSDPHGSFRFGSRCTSACEEGFALNGTADRECTSLGTWSADDAHCLGKICPILNAPAHGSLVCSDPHGPFQFGSQCKITCEEGFVLNGTAKTECTSSGQWSREIPICPARSCTLLADIPQHGRMNCSHPHSPFSYGSHCDFECNEGFWLKGTPTLSCSTSGHWSQDRPSCQAMRCPPLNPPSHGSLVCSDPHGSFRFGSRCTSACEEGFALNGTADRECTSLGTWSADDAHCLARSCTLLADIPQHGRMNCSHPHSPFSYGSHCDFECNEGFWLKGTPTLSCSTSGHWSQDRPSCQPLQCETIHALSLLSMNCTHPRGNFSFGSQCMFSCKDGATLNGTEMLFCSATGLWNDALPTCMVEKNLRGTGFLVYSWSTAALIVILVIVLALALLIWQLMKKRGNANIYSSPSWGERENPAFEF
ncbi:P-selectin [Aulostomus maculatus]